MGRASAPGSRRRTAGFTLTEIVVALLVLGVISAIVLPKMSNAPLLIVSEAEKVAGDIRFAQALSMTQGQRYLFRALSSTTYELELKGGTQVAHPSGVPSPIALGSGITMAPTTFLVGFDGQGVPYTDVAVSSVLASNATLTLTLTLSGSSRTVTVYSETGRVLVQ